MSAPVIKGLIVRAAKLQKTGDFSGAAAIYKEILETDSNNSEVLNLLGVVLTDAGLHKRAIGFFQKSLAIGGPNSGVLYNYGIALGKVGRLLEASRAFKNSAEVDPNSTDCWFNLGKTYHDLGDYKNAIKALIKTTELDPNNSYHFLALGNAYIDSCNEKKALTAYNHAVKVDPKNMKAQNNLGVLIRKRGNLTKATKIFQSISDLHPEYSAAQNNLGLIFAEQRKNVDAEIAYKRAINSTPDYSDASLNLAELYISITKFKKAEHCIKQAISKDSKNPALAIKLGIILQKQGLLKDAHATLARVTQLENGRDLAETSLANVLRDLGKFKSALALLKKYTTGSKTNSRLLANLALIQQHQGNLLAAEETLMRVIKADPDNWSLHLNLAHVLLLKGDFKNGWKEFNWRLKESSMQKLLTNLPGTLWDGGDPSDKSFLVISEQGIGDTFQFIRYVEILSSRAKKVFLVVPGFLKQILSHLSDCCSVISFDDPIPNCDTHVPLLSLPHLLRHYEIPKNYNLKHLPKRLVSNWRNRLSAYKYRVGLNWQGNRSYETDYLRSMSFKRLEPIVDNTDIDFIILQKELLDEKVPNKPNIIYFGSELDKCHAFMDTASIIMNLDLIVTTDTAIAHLAGILGKPVWLMLNSAPDWRWQLTRSDSPWYPKMKLFRQTSPGDWDNVIENVRTSINRYFDKTN